MKYTSGFIGFVLFLALAAGTAPAWAQMADVQPPSSVSYLSQGRYLIFQGNYVNDQGKPESGLVKFDSQTGMAWMLRPAPTPPKEGESLGFNWVPVKN